MISLDQIKQLESRVHSAVERIRTLTAENAGLKDRLSTYENRVGELERLVSEFKSEQAEIEAGIVAALAKLDGLEDTVTEPGSDEPETPAEEPAAGSDVTVQMNDELSSEDSPEGSSPDDPPSEGQTGGQESPSVDLIDSDEEEPELDIF